MQKFIKVKNKVGFRLSNLSRVLTSTFYGKNISATLDLNKSVKSFHLQVTKLLEFTNITEWDGKKLREREKEIREQAMILAGQCIAVLLYNLSVSPKI
ncbi:hypothetical protein NSMS1_62070 (plasmid) [Nostoc sp. MS1]|nr:hypothetical protein NSMS1_62070 [Nostoc sp. MS1]